MDLISTSTVKSILSQARLTPKKHLGQNFLVSLPVLESFLTACQLSEKDAVLEVGAGLGTVTLKLAQRVKQVVAIEIDQGLYHLLDQNLKQQNYPNAGAKIKIKTLRKDILKDATWKTAVGELTSFKSFKVVGSIPYQITSPLLHKILLAKKLPSLICFIIQKEVAQKIAAQPPQASYLSNLVALFGPAQIVGKTIRPSAFWPRPKVNSAILRIKLVSPNLKGPNDLNPEKFSRFLHRGFSHPRKMLRGVFAEKKLIKAGIKPTQRAQELQLQNWLKLYKITCQYQH